MKLRKAPLAFSLALSTLLVMGTTGFASGGPGMTNAGDNGMMNANDSGMMNMMESEGMNGMMNAMNSPEGQEMMNACSDFMSSMSDEKEADAE